MDIMVTVDPHDPGDELEHAIPWAHRLGGRVHLRAVAASSDSATAGAQVLRELEDRIPEALAGQAELLHGLPGRVLCDEAEDFDLIVMGTHARTGLNRLFLGSVAERLVRMVDGSVVVCPRGSAPLPSRGPVRVLCPVDAREPSLHAVTRVRQWLGDVAEIHVVYALADLFTSRRVGLVAEIDRPEEHPHYEWAKRQLRAALEAEGLQVAGLHLILTTSNHPAQELARFQETIEASLVAMPTHGRRGVSRVQFGSVTERVVRLSAVPSLVVR